MTEAEARKRLVAEFRKRGSMTLESARRFLARANVPSSMHERVIQQGVQGKHWAIAMDSLLPVGAATAPAGEAMSAIRDGAMYREGAIAALVDSGFELEEARAVVDAAVRKGEVVERGSMLIAPREADEKLTKAARDDLPDSAFADPKNRRFPINDAQHAIAAMGLLNTWFPRGYYTPNEYEKIRQNILKAYARFGITAHAPSALHAAVLGRAAESPQPTRVTNMAKKKLTKAERRAIAMRNLQKAWSARGVKAGTRSRGKAKAKPRRGREASEVAEKKAPAKKGLSKEQRREIAMKNLEKAWQAMGTPAAAPAAAAAPKPPRAPKPKATTTRGKRSPKGMVPSGKYFAPQSNAVISIKRVFPKENPVVEWDATTMGVAALGCLFGVVGAELVDRTIATMAKPDAKEPQYGTEAALAIRTKASAGRMLAQAAGAAVFGGGGYFTARYSQYAAAGMYGVAAGFLFKLFFQVTQDHIMPAIWKATGPAEKTWSNRLYADKQDWTQQGSVPALPPSTSTPTSAEEVVYGGNGQAAGWPGMIGRPMAMPAPPPPVPGFGGRGMDFGPVARTGVGEPPKGSVDSGQVGAPGWFEHCGCGTKGKETCPNCNCESVNCQCGRDCRSGRPQRAAGNGGYEVPVGNGAAQPGYAEPMQPDMPSGGGPVGEEAQPVAEIVDMVDAARKLQLSRLNLMKRMWAGIPATNESMVVK